MPRHIPLPSPTKGAQRRRRLHRAIERWDQDRGHCAEPTWRIAHVTLTMDTADVQAAYGAIKRFTAAMRQRWLGVRYFAWLELQRSGRVHYELLWLNFPKRSEVDLYQWVDHAWGHGRTSVRRYWDRGAPEKMVDYARSYAKKMGRKSYQQRYDSVPRGLRTSMNQQLEIKGPVLDLHRSMSMYAFHQELVERDWTRPGYTRYTAPWLEYLGELEHTVPIGGRCTAADFRRERHSRERGNTRE